jgi:Zn-dependent protease with chaperone function
MSGMEPNSLKGAILKAALFAALSLFVVPLCTWLFSEHAQAQRDQIYTAALRESLDGKPGRSEADKEAGRVFLAAHPPSTACDDDSPEVAQYRSIVCERYSELWQYHLADKVAKACLIGGALVLLAIFGFGALAFYNRPAQYLSLVFGWNLLRVTSTLQVITQGAMLVWLSFWLTAFFFESYFVKLIVFAAIVAGLAVVHAIVGIFKRPPPSAPLAGRLVAEADAPKLWAHLRRCAAHLGTAPPRQLIAGIDANFFVTEAPLNIGERTLGGRSLYVSLPLLRVLDRAEADAVLVHELAHFRGGDTASSAQLGPKLVDFDHYCRLMVHGGVTIVVYHVMYLYRLMFELALRRDSRQREFRADKVASQVISAGAIAQSLIKIAAYSNYRSQVEQQLFEQDSRHGNTLGIASLVAAGLAPYASSNHFIDSMKTANVPHPFDSHPPLVERMRNVGHEVAEQDFGAIVTSTPASGWIEDIQVAGAIESELWNEYEQMFASAHERSLAYRYLPATDAEREIVLRHFPDVAFELRGGASFGISYQGLRLQEADQLLAWDDIRTFEYENGMGADVLTIQLTEKGLLGAKTKKVKLPGISDHREAFKQTLGQYWHRHRTMRQSIPL